VLLHHNEHIHPGVTATGPSGSFVVEDHGSAGETFFYEIVLTVTDSAGLTDTKRVNVIPESPAPPPVTTLPVPWLGQDVGSVGKVGIDSFSNGSFTLQGSGTDIGGTSDSFNYVYQTLQGDGQIVARVASIQNTAVEAKAGVMIRESLAANSRYVMVRYKSNEHSASLRRANSGESTITSLGDAQILQRWQRIVRRGNQFSTYQSADGTNWLLIETVTVNMPSSVLFGIAVTAANNTVLCRAVIDNVKVNTIVANRPPTVSLTAPANNSTVTAPTSVTLRANASDSDGTISKVEFYQGGSLINSDQSAPYEYTVSLGSAGTSSFTARAYDNSGAVTNSSAVQVNVIKPVNGTGTGLKGEYFKKEEFKELKLTRIDPFIDFDWGKDKPIEGLDKDHFSVRWTGFIQPRFSGTQTFYVTTTDTVRLWVNGQLIINRSGTELTESRGAITLNAGQKYTINLEFAEKDKTASVKLEWSSPNQVREVIPRSQLYSQ
jgi:PA14 domain/Bacterial Ig domain